MLTCGRHFLEFKQLDLVEYDKFIVSKSDCTTSDYINQYFLTPSESLTIAACRRRSSSVPARGRKARMDGAASQTSAAGGGGGGT